MGEWRYRSIHLPHRGEWSASHTGLSTNLGTVENRNISASARNQTQILQLFALFGRCKAVFCFSHNGILYETSKRQVPTNSLVVTVNTLLILVCFRNKSKNPPTYRVLALRFPCFLIGLILLVMSSPWPASMPCPVDWTYDKLIKKAMQRLYRSASLAYLWFFFLFCLGLIFLSLSLSDIHLFLFDLALSSLSIRTLRQLVCYIWWLANIFCVCLAIFHHLSCKSVTEP